MNELTYRIDVSCRTCGKSFSKLRSDVKRSNNHYCNHSCAAKDANKNRKLDPNRTKKINCIECNYTFEVKANSSYKACEHCRLKATKTCTRCKSVVTDAKRGLFCTPCRKEIRRESGLVYGKKSAAARNKRSKNEIYFYQLCKSEWDNAKANEPFFESKYGKWDADVILHEYKVAALWNGVWHYKQVKAKHSLAQVQARDKIKIDSILSAGYTPYVIKDMGKHNPRFVEQEFIKFREFILNKT